jgi:hypothetical protein
MGISRSLLHGMLILLLAFILAVVTYAAEKYEAANFRGGANVFVTPEERTSNGLIAAGANIERWRRKCQRALRGVVKNWCWCQTTVITSLSGSVTHPFRVDIFLAFFLNISLIVIYYFRSRIGRGRLVIFEKP